MVFFFSHLLGLVGRPSKQCERMEGGQREESSEGTASGPRNESEHRRTTDQTERMNGPENHTAKPLAAWIETIEIEMLSASLIKIARSEGGSHSFETCSGDSSAPSSIKVKMAGKPGAKRGFDESGAVVRREQSAAISRRNEKRSPRASQPERMAAVCDTLRN